MLKSIKRSVAAVLAVVMVLSMSTVAFAATGSMRVFVNNEYTGVDNAYTDRYDDVYVDSWDDIREIFPAETEDMLSASPDDDVCLNVWANEFEYNLTVKNNKVYLEKNSNPSIDIPDIEIEPYPTSVRIYRNGVYVSNAAYAYYQDTNVYVNYPFDQSLNQIFGTVPQNIYAYATLSQWASAMGYKYYRFENDVFLNNDGKTPVVIMINGKKVNFPDQQPIVVDPGRTMIPIRAISEELGYNVEWSSSQAQAITISNSQHTINLYVGYPYMRFNERWVPMDVAPIVVNNRTLLPARFVVEAFGLNIWYDSSMLSSGGPGIVHIFS